MNFGPNRPRLCPKIGFCHFLRFGFLVFLWLGFLSFSYVYIISFPWYCNLEHKLRILEMVILICVKKLLKKKMKSPFQTRYNYDWIKFSCYSSGDKGFRIQMFEFRWIVQQLCKARDYMDFSQGLLDRIKAPHNCISKSSCLQMFCKCRSS